MTNDHNEIVQLQSRNAYLSFSDVQRGKKGDFFYIVGSDISLSQHDLTDASMNYIVQADTVHLTSDLQLPGHDLTINARLVRSEKAIRINTSGTEIDKALDYDPDNKAEFGESATRKGESGKDGKSGKNGGHGMRGGHVVLAAEAFELGGELMIFTDGSNGGRGQSGGDGGKASDGLNGEDGAISPFVKNGTAGTDAGNGGNGGDAGRGGDGGNAGHIFVGYVVSRDERKISLHSTGGVAGVAGEVGIGQAGGNGGKGGKEVARTKDENSGFLATIFGTAAGAHWTYTGKNVSDGRNGKHGENGKAASAGLQGALGEQQIAQIEYPFFYANIIGKQQWASSRLWEEANVLHSLCASYEQQATILHYAGLIYMGALGDQDALNETAILLQWLIRTLPDPVFFEQIRQLPATPLNTELLNSSIQWLALRSKTTMLIWQLSQGLDYFGNSWNWVPLMSFTKYQVMANDLITAATQAENLYQEYVGIQKNQSKMQELIIKSLNGLSERKSKFEANRLTALQNKKDMELRIHAMENTLRKLEDQLEKKATEFVDQLRKELGMATAKEVFNLIVTGVSLATSIGPVITAVKAGGVIRSAINNVIESGKPIIIDEVGKDKSAIDKEKKEQEAELNKAIGNVKTMVTAPYTIYQSGGNLFDLSRQIVGADQSFGYRSIVVMKREQFENLMKSVYQKMPKEKVDTYRTAFYDYLNSVEEYQQKMKEYHALAIEEDKNRSEQLQIDAETTRIRQLMGQEIDFALPSFHMYILNMYTESKQHLVKFLYEEYRAFRYITLIEERFRNIRDNRVAELSQIHADITRKITGAINDSENLWQSFQGITFVLTEERFPEQFAALRKQEVAIFPLLLDNEALRDKIAGKAQMMVSNCQVYIPGAKTSSEAIHIEYEQAGYSTFLDSYGKRFDFIHRASHGYYEYEKSAELHAIRTGAIQSSGGELQLGENDGRIMPGLLSIWSFQLPKEDIRGEVLNMNLDLSETNQIVVIFKGRAKSYMRNTTNRIPDQFKLPNKELPVMDDDELYAIPTSITVDPVISSKVTHDQPATANREQSMNNIVIEW